MPISCTCPGCGVTLKVRDELAGKTGKCPKCGTAMRIPEAGAAPYSVQPAPQRRPAPPPPPEEAPTSEPGALPPTGPAEPGRWFDYAKKHAGAALLPMAGFTFIILFGAIPCIGWAVFPPLAWGLPIVALAQLKGQPWTFGSFFSGFNLFLQAWGVFLIHLGLSVLAMVPSLIVTGIVTAIIGTSVSTSTFSVSHTPPPVSGDVFNQGGRDPFQVEKIQVTQQQSSSMGVLAVVLKAIDWLVYLVCVLVSSYLQTRFLFVPLLILDRGTGVFEAFKDSWQITRAAHVKLFGLYLLTNVAVFLISIFTCILGFFVAVPFAILFWTAGYLLLAGSQPPVEPTPAEA